MISCPLCGSNSSYVSVLGLTICVCKYCAQAYIQETNNIIRLDKAKLSHISFELQDFIAIALTMQQIYTNWEIIGPRVS